MEDTKKNFSFRQANKWIKAMRLEDNSAIIIKSTNEKEFNDIIGAIRTACDMGRLKNIVFIGVKNLDDISTMDENEMKKYGWYTLNSAIKTLMEKQKLITTRKKDDTEQTVGDNPVKE